MTGEWRLACPPHCAEFYGTHWMQMTTSSPNEHSFTLTEYTYAHLSFSVGYVGIRVGDRLTVKAMGLFSPDFFLMEVPSVSFARDCILPRLNHCIDYNGRRGLEVATGVSSVRLSV